MTALPAKTALVGVLLAFASIATPTSASAAFLDLALPTPVTVPAPSPIAVPSPVPLPTPSPITVPTPTPLALPTPIAVPTPSPIALPPVIVPTPTLLPSHLSDAHRDAELLVRFAPGLQHATRTGMFDRIGATLDYVLPLDDVHLIDVEGDVDAARAWLELQPGVLWAEPNHAVQAAVTLTYGQGDPYYPKQWAIENFGNEGRVFDADIDATASWVVTKGAGSVVGVVDTGVDASHPDLAANLVGGVNFVPDGHSTTADGSGHGTHVTGIIAALENTIGIVGAAPAAKAMPLRALDDTGAGTSATIASAFAYAGKEGLRVVNASLGSTSPSKAVADAISSNPNTLYVVAAGNSGSDLDNGGANYPCQLDLANVLCVAASDDHDQLAPFSNRGVRSVDLAAPGAGIISTAPGNAYRYESGTSMASPFVAAVAAELTVLHPDWTAVRIKREIMATVDQPSTLHGTSVTNGRLNAGRAVGVFVGPDGERPSQVTSLVGLAGVGKAELSWAPVASVDLVAYQVENLVNGVWTQSAVVLADSGETFATISGLPAGVPQTYRVRGIDRSGEEGEASTSVVVIPSSSASQATPKAPENDTGVSNSNKSSGTKTAVAAGSAAAAATTKEPVLSAVKRARKKGRISGLTFRLSLATSVTVTAVPITKAVKAERVLTKTFKLRAGAARLEFGSGNPAIKLTKGTWKITLATKANSVSLKLAVR